MKFLKRIAVTFVGIGNAMVAASFSYIFTRGDRL